MKKILSIFLFFAVLACGCNEEDLLVYQTEFNEYVTFTATFEQNESRTYVEDGNLLCWTKGDQISLFQGNTLNYTYKFDGETGDNDGTFSYQNKPFGSGVGLDCNYAVYPYSSDTKISANGDITTILPAVQNYAENSFGLGANVMVAATMDTDDANLKFKNVGGCIKLQLYGDDVTVKSITLTGNNNEKLAGKAIVKASYGQVPTLSMADDATHSITLKCGESGVNIGTSPETATAFWMTVPPITFVKGFTVTITDVDGNEFSKSTSRKIEVKRNVIKPMDAFNAQMVINTEKEDNLREALIKLYQSTNGDNWKRNDNWCSDKPIEEWYGVTNIFNICLLDLSNNNLTGKIEQTFPDDLISLNCENNQLTSLDVSGSTSLKKLFCDGNQLTSLDVSGCTSLVDLYCYENQLTSLNVSGCSSLVDLSCDNNQLTSLDVSGCTSLERLDCDENQLASLDVSGCKLLERLDCYENQLASLDVSGCTSLVELYCYNNQLTSLDVSGSTSLKKLFCQENQLTSLDVSGCSSLEYLYCYNNQLASLDVSGCSSLEYLYCYENQLTSLDVSSCTSLVDLLLVNNQLTSLDVSGCSSLEYLYCYENQLTSLDVSGCTSLKYLYCYNNQLTSLDVSSCTLLQYLYCQNNKISSVIPEWFSQLEYFLYDQRYTYSSEYTNGYKDNGYGWWYPGEPEKGEHTPD